MKEPGLHSQAEQQEALSARHSPELFAKKVRKVKSLAPPTTQAKQAKYQQ